MSDTNGADGTNDTVCTDEQKRELWREALISKIAHESKMTEARSLGAVHRNVIKKIKKAAGEAFASEVASVLKKRFEDPEVLVLHAREHLKVLQLSGLVENVKGQIVDRLDIEEPTRKERDQIARDRAMDDGTFEGRSGAARTDNPHLQGTELYAEWDLGWAVGREALSTETADGATPVTAAGKRVAKAAEIAARASEDTTMPGTAGDQPIH